MLSISKLLIKKRQPNRKAIAKNTRKKHPSIMNALNDIIQRCHQQHNASLRQRKTVVTPALNKSIPYDFKVHCARGYAVILDDFERADISVMPIGHAPENDRGPGDFGGDRFLKRQGIQDWQNKRWYASWGIQIYTGIPSERDGARWHDFDFKYEAICAAPEAVSTCIEALVKTTGKPLLTLTKSGGLRFSCRVPDYLHPKTDAAKSYTYKYAPTPENPYHRDVYLEVLGENGYSRWDGRYKILLGNLLDPPVITNEVLFVPVDAFRAALHEPGPFGETYFETAPAPSIVPPASLGSENLDLAKAAFLARGFSYLREDIGFYHWTRHDNHDDPLHVSLWEDQDIVWLRASTPNTELPMRAVPITDVWDDTGITPPISATGLPINSEMLSVREGKLSPLAIKRALPIFNRQDSTKKVYQTPEEKAAQMRRAFDTDARVLGVVSETTSWVNQEVESYVLNGGATCLNTNSRRLADIAEQRYQALGLPSFARWRARLYRWDRVKDIPVEERMANPFQCGNPCEDPERCLALEEKGGNPDEVICPKCPVYTECQTRGYLSQPSALQNAKAQISPHFHLFFDPQHAAALAQILDSTDETQRICIIDERNVETAQLFLDYWFSKKVLAQWTLHWRGSALGNFAKSLLSALETQSKPNANAIAPVRATVQAFQRYEEKIIRQMCLVNVRGKVVERGTVDAETGQALAHFTIAFEGGAYAYIPLDPNAEDRLRDKGLPTLSPDFFIPNEDIEIPMQMPKAIALGIYDPETVEKIASFPTVCRDPNWTLWHQLKCFFAHYKRDADAPMRWNDTTLQFCIPPALHPSVKRLLLMFPSLSEQHLHKVFPNENIEVIHTQPTAWMPGNQVFQIRTGIYSIDTLFNFDSNWDLPSLSKMGERFFFGIRAEIERDPSVQHAIISNARIIRQLVDLSEKENVCRVVNFKNLNWMDPDFQKAEVLWIIGMPHWPQSTIWWHAQRLFGSDAEPLYYEGGLASDSYKDERIQRLYRQKVVGILTRCVEQTGRLSRSTGKKVVLITSVELPNITDRPETLLFDWEDFQIAGGLDKLPEAIATRERFERERDNLTGESKREEVERVLGCSARKANRVLKSLRGGNIPRVSFQEQILALLANGEKKASELSEAIGSSPQSVGNELKRLVDIGEIVKVRRGVYTLPKA